MLLFAVEPLTQIILPGSGPREPLIAGEQLRRRGIDRGSLVEIADITAKERLRIRAPPDEQCVRSKQ